MVNMVVLAKLMIPFLLCHASYAVNHSLKFLLTASSGDPDISELIFVTVVDDMEVVYCDGSKKILEQRQDWMKKAFDDNPDLLVAFTYECFEYQPSMYKILISNWKQHLNQSEGVYILQCMTGCEQDEHSGEVKCFCQFSYNVEGLFEFDQKTRTWITLKPDFHISEQMMDGHKNLIKYLENLFSTVFPDILKILLGYGSSSLNKTVLPSVSLLQKTSSSPVSCHATGFYPDKAMMFWRKDGEELHEGVDPGEILPNNDETFQMTVDLNVSSVTHEDWSRYECVFQLSGDEDIITKLDKTVARTNWAERAENPSDTTAPVIATVVVLLIFILIAAVGFAVYKKKKGKRFKGAPENRTEASVRLSRENITARYI